MGRDCGLPADIAKPEHEIGASIAGDRAVKIESSIGFIVSAVYRVPAGVLKTPLPGMASANPTGSIGDLVAFFCVDSQGVAVHTPKGSNRNVGRLYLAGCFPALDSKSLDVVQGIVL